jgi:hypothetical protein
VLALLLIAAVPARAQPEVEPDEYLSLGRLMKLLMTLPDIPPVGCGILSEGGTFQDEIVEMLWTSGGRGSWEVAQVPIASGGTVVEWELRLAFRTLDSGSPGARGAWLRITPDRRYAGTRGCIREEWLLHAEDLATGGPDQPWEEFRERLDAEEARERHAEERVSGAPDDALIDGDRVASARAAPPDPAAILRALLDQRSDLELLPGCAAVRTGSLDVTVSDHVAALLAPAEEEGAVHVRTEVVRVAELGASRWRCRVLFSDGARPGLLEQGFAFALTEIGREVVEGSLACVAR